MMDIFTAFKGYFSTLLVVLVLGFLAQDLRPTSAPRPVTEVLTAVELSEAYQADASAANTKFAGQRVSISGAIDAVRLDELDTAPTVTLQGEYAARTRPEFIFNPAYVVLMDSFRKDTKLLIVCTGHPYTGATIMFSDCELGD